MVKNLHENYATLGKCGGANFTSSGKAEERALKDLLCEVIHTYEDELSKNDLNEK